MIKRAPLRAAMVVLALLTCAFWLVPAQAHDEKARVPPTKFDGVMPILRVDSVEESIIHYTTVLGFEKHWEWPEKNENKTFGSVTNGKVEIFLCEGSQGTPGTWIYLTVGDIDALHKQYVEKHADIVQAPKDQPWGMREMLVRDLDGHTLRIGQGIPPKTPEKPDPATTQPAK